jgi:lipoate-protein ligase B
MAINVDPDLSHFSGIVPCGVNEQKYGVTSLADLGIPVSLAEVDTILRREYEALFGATADQAVGRTEKEPPSAPSKRSASVPSR